MIEINYDEINNQLKLTKEYEEFFTDKGVIITGKNADGKTKFLKSLVLDNSIYIPIHSRKKNIELFYESKLDELPELDSKTSTGLFNFLTTHKEKIEKILSNNFLNKDIFLGIGEKEFREFNYSDGTLISSQGELNIILLFIIISYYSSMENKKIFLLDEPNTNLDDINANSLLQKLLDNVYATFWNKIIIVATSNNKNIISSLEDFFVVNINEESEEISYSSDLIGNTTAIDRFFQKYNSPLKLISETRELLSKVFLLRKDYIISDKNHIILLDKKRHDGAYRVLFYNKLSKMDKIIYDKIRDLPTSPSSKKFTITGEWAYEKKSFGVK